MRDEHQKLKESPLTEQINNETEINVHIGNQVFNEKDWDMAMGRIDGELERLQEALDKKEENRPGKKLLAKIRKLFGS